MALVLSWMAAQAVYLATGESVPVWFYIPADLLVIGALLVWHSSRIDWLILSLFPLQWSAYFWTDPVQQWWVLWGLALCQFILAGPWKTARAFGGSSGENLRKSYAGIS